MMQISGNSVLQFLKNNAVLVLLCALFLLAGILLINDTMFYNPDSAHYLAWARSLAFLDGFKITFGPEPIHYVFNAPLYPLLLAPAARLFPYNAIAAKGITLLCGVVMLMLMYSYVASTAGTAAGLFATIFLLINPLFLMYSTQILSDVPFCVCLILFLIIAEKMISAEKMSRGIAATWIITVCAGMFLRDVGLVMMLCAAVFLVMRKEYRYAYVLVAVTLSLYLLWLGRNELMALRMGEAPWRNTRLYFEHAVTGQDASILDEFMSRVRINGTFYGSLVGGLVFMPQYGGWMYDVVRETDPFLSFMRHILTYAGFPLTVLTIAVSGYGLRRLWQTSNATKLILLFLVLYMGTILLYPTFDIRYLFPILILMIFFCAVAYRELMRQWDLEVQHLRRAVFAAGISAVTILLATPNIAWTSNFLGTSHAYCRSPLGLYFALVRQESYPGEFTKLFRLAGQWIVDHTDSNTVLMSKYRAVGLWSGGRKVVTGSPFMSLDEFECTVRDYQVGYLVSLLEAHTLDEFAFHMTMSRRFRFEPVSRIGDVEILKVYPQAETSARKESASVMPSPTLQGEGGPPEEQKLRIDFLYGLLMLKQGHHDSAFAVFQRLRSNGRLELYATYYAAIAAAFSMHLDVSASLLEQLGETPQAGTFLRQIGYYRGVLQSLRSVVHERSAGEAASLYRSISLGLWDEGFRLQAQEMLNRSLGMDPENFASLVFAALYALQQGDTKGARLYCAHAERVKPRDPLVGSFSRILGRHSPGIAEEHLAACKDFAAMGLSELAIDEALLALRTDPTNTTTLSVLVDLYLAKHRYAPARRILDLLCTLNPHDADARTKLAAVLTRW